MVPDVEATHGGDAIAPASCFAAHEPIRSASLRVRNTGAVPCLNRRLPYDMKSLVVLEHAVAQLRCIARVLDPAPRGAAARPESDFLSQPYHNQLPEM